MYTLTLHSFWSLTDLQDLFDILFTILQVCLLLLRNFFVKFVVLLRVHKYTLRV